MNKSKIRLSKSGIEYLDYVWNFYSGCQNQQNGLCPITNCWAKRITERFKDHYPNSFEPTFYPEAFLSPMDLRKPSIIGCAFMGDIFGDWVDPNKPVPVSLYGQLGQQSIELAKIGINPVPKFTLKETVFTTIKCCPQHTFVFLTKCIWNLPKWGKFPDNCLVGISVTNLSQFGNLQDLGNVSAKRRFVSFEPLLDYTAPDLRYVDEIIIGSCTGTKSEIMKLAESYPGPTPMQWGRQWTLQPKIGWVQKIAEAANKTGIPVFLKENLRPLFKQNSVNVLPYWALKDWDYRQEFPK